MKPTDEQLTGLLLKARDGDQWSFSSFVRHTQDGVQATLSFLGSRQSAEDLAQETFLRAYKALASYRGDAPARSWLMTIARRVAVDAIRRETRQRRLRVLISGQSAVQQAGSQQTNVESETTELGILLADLDRDRRDAFVLTQIAGMSYEEAAQACGCAVGTIRSRVARARDELASAWSGVNEPSVRRSRSAV